MDGHHLILGELVDLVTGETIPDTHDERYRQKIAAFLLEEKDYLKTDIQSRKELLLKAGPKKALISIDFIIRVNDHPAMLVQFGPGSMVTRRRSSLAAARLITPLQIPVVVVTNGEDAEILDGSSGKLVATGLSAIPTRPELKSRLATHRWERIEAERAEMESRIAFCYEVDGACPCDDTICHL